MDGKGEDQMKKDGRFEKVYKQGTFEGMEIWIDRVTGVNYLVHFDGYKGGITPLLDPEGKPVVTPIAEG